MKNVLCYESCVCMYVCMYVCMLCYRTFPLHGSSDFTGKLAICRQKKTAAFRVNERVSGKTNTKKKYIFLTTSSSSSSSYGNDPNRTGYGIEGKGIEHLQPNPARPDLFCLLLPEKPAHSDDPIILWRDPFLFAWGSG